MPLSSLTPLLVSEVYVNFFRFFVISGFLMAFLWSRNKSSSLNVFKQFYLRRIKRIVPIYLIIVAFVYVVGKFTLLESDQVSLRRRALWSIVFLSNVGLFEEKDYFAQVRTRGRHIWIGGRGAKFRQFTRGGRGHLYFPERMLLF